jgi:hypothetical protein
MGLWGYYLYLFSKVVVPEIISGVAGLWGCVKSLLPPSAAEYSSERHVIFTISRSEIVKMTCLSKHNSVQSAVKNLFTQPRRFAPNKNLKPRLIH